MRTRLLVILAAALVTGACASTIGKMKTDMPALDYREYAGEPIERFTAFDIDGWHAVSRNQLVLWTGVNDAYLLTVWDSCDRLEFVDGIAVNRVGNSVSRFDSITVEGRRCPINEIRPVDVRRMKIDRAAQRAK